MSTARQTETTDLDTVLKGCSLSVHALGAPLRAHGDTPERTHFWHVLTPPEWPVPAGLRPRVSADDNRRWYEGNSVSADAARADACDVLGRCFGARLAQYTGVQVIPAQTLPAASRIDT